MRKEQCFQMITEVLRRATKEQLERVYYFALYTCPLPPVPDKDLQEERERIREQFREYFCEQFREHF